MTEENKSNREIYLELCRTVWDLDDKSMKYIEHRTSDDWEPVEELKELISKGDSYEDQRIRFNIDMANKDVQTLFQNEDKSYELFRNYFTNAIRKLKTKNCIISYNEFITNKVVYNKNVTKIKKVFETVYKEDIECFYNDFGTRDDTLISDKIVKAFEKIGASKKSAKKLQLVISFNPIDWFLSSTSEKFSSCFNLNNESGGYPYCLGIPFLSGDNNRVMLYITDGSKKEFLGIKVDSVQTRTWSILNENNKSCVVKWYPNDTIGTTPINSITKTNMFLSKDNFSKGKHPIDMLTTKEGVCVGVYSDMGKWEYDNGKLKHIGNEKTGQQWFTDRGTPLHTNRYSNRSSYSLESNFGNLSVDSVGYRIPKWKKYGYHLDMLFRAKCTCSSCGEIKTGFMAGNTSSTYRYFCKDCFVDKMFVCDNCGCSQDTESNEKFTVNTIFGESKTYCKSCFEDLYYCECCGNYGHDEDFYTVNDGSTICYKCLEAGKTEYKKCDSCGCLTKDIMSNYNTLTNELNFSCGDCKKETINAFTFGRDFRIITRKSVRGILD